MIRAKKPPRRPPVGEARAPSVAALPAPARRGRRRHGSGQVSGVPRPGDRYTDVQLTQRSDDGYTDRCAQMEAGYTG